MQRAPKVNVLLCISTAVLLYCTQVRQMHACTLFAITFSSEIASGNCRAQHINKNVSWVEGTLLSQLCQRCDREVENMVSLLQKFTRTQWASVSQAWLTRCDIRLPVVSSGSRNPRLRTSTYCKLYINFSFFFSLLEPKNSNTRHKWLGH